MCEPFSCEGTVTHERLNSLYERRNRRRASQLKRWGSQPVRTHAGNAGQVTAVASQPIRDAALEADLARFLAAQQ